MKMKAVDLKDNKRRDDLFLNRLFSYLDSQIPFQIDQIVPIRKQVFLIKAESLKFILKGFTSYKKLKLQEAFTNSLKNEGFVDSYIFYPISKEEPLFFENKYYGCIEYILPSKDQFTYNSKDNQKEGLELLKKFHTTSAKLVNRYNTLLPPFQLLEKWHERVKMFRNNLSLIKFFLHKDMLEEILSWADWSLKKMESEFPIFLSDPRVILHGDVAHHNFLRGFNNKLYLIDFDLISIGPISTDYLQFANRILPFLNWSFEELQTIKEFIPYLKNKQFLIALTYPTDILREWNRIIRGKLYHDPNHIRPIMDLTVGQFNKRQLFFKDILKMVEKKDIF